MNAFAKASCKCERQEMDSAALRKTIIIFLLAEMSIKGNVLV